jgi:hypothetical protein
MAKWSKAPAAGANQLARAVEVDSIGPEKTAECAKFAETYAEKYSFQIVNADPFGGRRVSAAEGWSDPRKRDAWSGLKRFVFVDRSILPSGRLRRPHPPNGGALWLCDSVARSFVVSGRSKP